MWYQAIQNADSSTIRLLIFHKEEWHDYLSSDDFTHLYDGIRWYYITSWITNTSKWWTCPMHEGRPNSIHKQNLCSTLQMSLQIINLIFQWEIFLTHYSMYPAIDHLFSGKHFFQVDMNVNDKKNISEMRLGNGKTDSRRFPRPETLGKGTVIWGTMLKVKLKWKGIIKKNLIWDVQNC